jgi:hypothetical protein
VAVGGWELVVAGGWWLVAGGGWWCRKTHVGPNDVTPCYKRRRGGSESTAEGEAAGGGGRRLVVAGGGGGSTAEGEAQRKAKHQTSMSMAWAMTRTGFA